MEPPGLVVNVENEAMPTLVCGVPVNPPTEAARELRSNVLPSVNS